MRTKIDIVTVNLPAREVEYKAGSIPDVRYEWDVPAALRFVCEVHPDLTSVVIVLLPDKSN